MEKNEEEVNVVSKKGFTLVELLATIVVLGVIMMIAVPNIIGIIDKNKESNKIEDAKRLVSVAQYANGKEKTKLDLDECRIYSLEEIDNNEFEKSPNSDSYDKDKSLAVVRRSASSDESSTYEYYYSLIESKKANEDYTLKQYKSLDADTDETYPEYSLAACEGDIKACIRTMLTCSEPNPNDVSDDEAVPDVGGTKVDQGSQRLTLFDTIDSRSETDSTIEKVTDEKYSLKYYYYKAGATNNNVLFADKCWKIVRTTAKDIDGVANGVKLIYAGNAKDDKCEGSLITDSDLSSAFHATTKYTNSEEMIGYMFAREIGKSTNDTSSSVKSTVDKWYKEKIDEKGGMSYLANVYWCNDRSSKSSNNYYAPYNRKSAGSSELSCKEKRDTFYVGNKEANLTYYVGLLTSDEVTKIGKGSSSYLAFGSTNWWTMSPVRVAGFDSEVFVVDSTGTLSSGKVITKYAVRPTIAIKYRVYVTIGTTGSADNPYKLNLSRYGE